MNKHYRILVLGKYSRWVSFMLHGVIQGTIQNGWQALPIEIEPVGSNKPKEHKQGLIDKIDRFQPHIIFCHAIFGEGKESFYGVLDVLKYAREKYTTKVCYHMGDPRDNPRFNDDISDWIDIGLMNVETLIEENNVRTNLLEKFGDVWKIPCFYWPFGCWQMNEFPQPIKSNLRTIFVGSMSTNKRYLHRTEFITECKNSSILKTQLMNEQGQTHFYNSELVRPSDGVIGFTAKVDRLEMFLDARSFIFGGYGGLVFQRYTNGAETILKDREHIIYFKSDDVSELEDLYKYYVNDYPEKGIRIREQAFDYIQKNHNYKNRVSDVVDILEGARDRCRYLLTDFE